MHFFVPPGPPFRISYRLRGRNDVTRYANFGAVSQPEKIENLTLTRYANFGAAGCREQAVYACDQIFSTSYRQPIHNHTCGWPRGSVYDRFSVGISCQSTHR